MDNEIKKEELQSRREFFKKAAKAALPVVGAIVVSNPLFAQIGGTSNFHVVPNPAHSGANCRECTGECSGSCQGYCLDTCKGTCENTCSGSCDGSNSAGNPNTSCGYGCSSSCAGSCHGTCYRTCKNSCSGYSVY